MVDDDASNWVVASLGSHHQIDEFDCGTPSLDEFLKKYAKQHRRRGLAQTYVAVSPSNPEVLGYYSIANGAVHPERLSPPSARGLPSRQPIPVVLLARLAVASAVQGKGLGEFLLLDAMERTLRVSGEIGIAAMAVHALNEGAMRFYRRYGFASMKDDKLHLFLSIKAIQSILES